MPTSRTPTRRALPRPSPAMVVALLALVAACGGTAWAATTISGSDIKTNSIPGNRMVNGTLTATQIKNAGVTRAKIASGAVNAGLIASGAVVNAKLASNAVTAGKIQAGAVGATQLADGGVSSAKLAGASVLTSAIAGGAVQTNNVADGAVTRAKLDPAARVPRVVVRRSAEVSGGQDAVLVSVASCAAGETAIAGGVGTTTPGVPGVSVVNSRPTPNGDGNTPTGWEGGIINGSSTAQTMVVYAVCAQSS